MVVTMVFNKVVLNIIFFKEPISIWSSRVQSDTVRAIKPEPEIFYNNLRGLEGGSQAGVH